MDYPRRKRAVHRALKTGNKQIYLFCSYADMSKLIAKFHIKTKIYPDRNVQNGMFYALWDFTQINGLNAWFSEENRAPFFGLDRTAPTRLDRPAPESFLKLYRRQCLLRLKKIYHYLKHLF